MNTLKQYTHDLDLSKRHLIDLEWEGPSFGVSDDCKVDIFVSSRKLKNQENSPSDMLFRTHQYEFKIIPNKQFFEWSGRKSGHIVELKLFKKMNGEKEQYQEYTLCGVPVINYQFTEDVFAGYWVISLIWPDEKNRISFRGDFCFRLTCFRKVDDDTYRRVFTKSSSTFKIVSKPGVYLSRKKKLLSQKDKQLQKQEIKKQQKQTLHIPSRERNVPLVSNLISCTPPSSTVQSTTSIMNQSSIIPTMIFTPPVGFNPTKQQSIINTTMIKNQPILPKPEKTQQRNIFFEEIGSNKLSTSEEDKSLQSLLNAPTPSPSEFLLESTPPSKINETKKIQNEPGSPQPFTPTSMKILSLDFSQDSQSNSQEWDMSMTTSDALQVLQSSQSDTQQTNQSQLFAKMYEATSPLSAENKFWFEKITQE